MSGAKDVLLGILLFFTWPLIVVAAPFILVVQAARKKEGTADDTR